MQSMLSGEAGGHERFRQVEFSDYGLPKNGGFRTDCGLAWVELRNNRIFRGAASHVG